MSSLPCIFLLLLRLLYLLTPLLGPGYGGGSLLGVRLGLRLRDSGTASVCCCCPYGDEEAPLFPKTHGVCAGQGVVVMWPLSPSPSLTLVYAAPLLLPLAGFFVFCTAFQISLKGQTMALRPLAVYRDFKMACQGRKDLPSRRCCRSVCTIKSAIYSFRLSPSSFFVCY